MRGKALRCGAEWQGSWCRLLGKRRADIFILRTSQTKDREQVLVGNSRGNHMESSEAGETRRREAGQCGRHRGNEIC